MAIIWRLFSWIVFLSVLVGVSSCAVVHRYSPYFGTVVDVDTEEPIAGASVLAVYYTQSYGLAGSSSHFLEAKETATDQNGEFKIESMTSFTFRPLQSFEPWAWVTIFKPGYAGYGCFPWHKDVEPKQHPFKPNNKITIKLPKLNTKEERCKYHSCYPPPVVSEKNYPNLFYTIQKERIYLGLEPESL